MVLPVRIMAKAEMNLPKGQAAVYFLKNSPVLAAMDVTIFSQYRVYLAAPLFSEAERTYNASIAGLLRNNLFDVFLPQETGDDSETRNKEGQAKIFADNVSALKNSDILTAIIDGADADSGTSWEMGYASALGKKIIALRTDFRRSGSHEKVNLMLEESSTVVISKEKLLEAIKSPLFLKSDS